MKARDFWLLMLVCLVWGVNMPVSRTIVQYIPPITSVGVRFLGVSLCLFPFLRPIPRQLPLVILLGLCYGAFHFATMFIALSMANAGAVSVVMQMGLPFTTLLSMIFLGEQIHKWRLLGILLALSGVIIVLLKPGALAIEIGLIWALVAALFAATGTILIKALDPIAPLQFQAWTTFVSFPVLFLVGYFVEGSHWAAMTIPPPKIIALIIFAIVAVSIFAHTAYYHLIRLYDVTMIVPITLLAPVWAVVSGAIFLHEKITPQLVLGGILTLSGVAIIALRPNKVLADKLVNLAGES